MGRDVNASMRPRFMNRGRARERPARSATARFNEAPIHESGKRAVVVVRGQPGLRFNEAPIHESGKDSARESNPRGRPASMRPRFMNRGRTMPSLASPDTDLASMRPRFMNRGSVQSTHRRCGTLWASMRPRFMNRGRAPTGALPLVPCSLQ